MVLLRTVRIAALLVMKTPRWHRLRVSGPGSFLPGRTAKRQAFALAGVGGFGRERLQGAASWAIENFLGRTMMYIAQNVTKDA